MVADLRLTLFGQPSICQGEREVFFTFSKINALLYYLVINESVNRDEIAGMLWEDKDNQTAKKNLRNTIYQVNKILGADYVIAPSRSILTLNPALPISSDVGPFLADPVANLSLYQGEFLKGFYLKSNETFDLWLSKMRTYFEQLYIKTSYQKLDQMMETASVEEIEAILFQLMAIDEFEEKNYQLLMSLYQKHHRYGKVIETYYRLVNLLDKELGISPSDASQQIYDEVVAKDRNQRKVKQFLRNTNHFFGRVTEIKQLEAFFDSVYNSQRAHTIVLVGGTGIGKRTVTRQVLANQTKHFQMVTTECDHQSDDTARTLYENLLDGLGDLAIQHQLMSTNQWQALMQSFFFDLYPLDTLTQQAKALSKPMDCKAITHVLVTISKRIAQQKPLVLLIEDIHWLEQDSIYVLHTMIQQLSEYPVAFVLTKHLSTTPHLEQFLNQLIYHKQADIITLQPLTQTESLQYLHQKLDHLSLAQDTFIQAYELSEGNPFFLTEYAAQLATDKHFSPLTPAIKAKFALKIDVINSHEEALLHYLACCRKPAPIGLLAQLLTLSLEETINLVESLTCHHLIIEECLHDNITVCFHQRLFGIYCYEKLSLAKKRMLHAQIAQALESNLSFFAQPSIAFEDIAYHYRQAKQPIKALSYQLDFIEARLHLHHELFPIYSQILDHYPQSDQGTPSIQQELAALQKQLQDLEKRYEQSKDFQGLQLRFLYLEGCYHIRIGQYEKGIANIQKVIAVATDLHHTSYLLEGYRQLIYYCIQVENIPEMKYYTELALEAAAQANNHEAIALNLRLSGLYHLIIGKLDQAIQQLNASIDCFSLTTSLQSKYPIQIAAALDYLAEIQQMRGCFEQAIVYQRKAIQLTHNKLSEPSIISFYIGLGISYFYQGNFSKAADIFMQSKEALKTLRFPWKEAQLEVYLTLLKCEQGDYGAVSELFAKKDELISLYSNPRDKGMIYYVLALTKYKLETNHITCDTLVSCLTDDFSTYYHIAKNHLNPYRDCHFLKRLEKCKQALTSKTTKKA
ncbi:MAG: LuxR family transcriptional regulator [Streptococcus pyogenes]|nr:MAG: LuxR family transcriptional regulator [Streptococcus pyogenes]